MDSDGLGALLLLLLHWRVLVWLLASSLFAVLLVHVLPWFSGLQGVLLVVFGVVAGIAWEAALDGAKRPSVEAKPAPLWAVGLAAAFCGAVWGGASSGSTGSFIAGVVLLALAVWAWVWHARSEASKAQSPVVLHALLAFVGYLLGALCGSIV